MPSFRLLPVLALSTLLVAGCTSPGAAEPGASTAPGGQDAAHESRLDLIKSRGSLIVCTTGDYRPFTYKDPETGEFSGIDIAMVQDLASRLDVDIEYVQTTWKDLMPDFLAGCDIGAGGVSVSLARAEQAFYSSTVLDDGKTPITRCGEEELYDTVEEINSPGVRSITPIGGTNEIFADENYPNGEIIRFEDNNTIFDEIVAGRADVMTTDAAEVKWVDNEYPELCAVDPDNPFNFSQKAYLLPLGDTVFQEYVNQWLNLAENDGTYDAAKEPWWG
ncbi:transporter substrate-binding domain-containing protein [Arthrobacter caoxuetaonis]|uniref:Transporter substrate-binding domain-containing protein n=1 Tax=Arthrobacter caoxuetaonis TaxID=2886935 RepID=A0A9X1SE34_9MICC|nr:transporter substrate-binding domain-containing protein [Arthrobacter caoxuetaonis]MCC3284158.1 transporter substrate-binding domain-containing protein [Arthrobacter caoxuetaonis]MCC3299517.1 transporter substrate-binding domain-containing protein [Arthrobacter caoxuetaonis]USQ57767.1 transporter substrate-binding domain-containing protein [Arthrobacter caoxuetaonis]